VTARPKRAAAVVALAATALCLAGWHFVAIELLGPIAARATGNPPRLAFWQRVPEPLQAYLADDIKLLIGWTFDAAISRRAVRA